MYDAWGAKTLLDKFHGTFKASFIVFLMVFAFTPIRCGAQDENAHVATVLVNPSKLVVSTNESFTVNITINDVSDLAGWEFVLLWNRTVINCTRAEVHSPSEWANGTLDYGPGIMNEYDRNWWNDFRGLLMEETGYNSTFNGIYFKSQTYEYPEPTFNGSITIVTLTFQALQPGATSLSLKDTILGNSSGSAMSHTYSDGFVYVLDVVAFTNCFGLRQRDLRWNAGFDVNGDGKIDILDAIIMAQEPVTSSS